MHLLNIAATPLLECLIPGSDLVNVARARARTATSATRRARSHLKRPNRRNRCQLQIIHTALDAAAAAMCATRNTETRPSAVTLRAWRSPLNSRPLCNALMQTCASLIVCRNSQQHTARLLCLRLESQSPLRLPFRVLCGVSSAVCRHHKRSTRTAFSVRVCGELLAKCIGLIKRIKSA